MIILEGADNTGKSTLARHLHQRFGFRTWHAGGPGYSRARLAEELGKLSSQVYDIADRVNFISGPVYEQALDVRPTHDWQASKGLLNYLLKNNLVMVIHCTGHGANTTRPDEDQDYANKVLAQNEDIRAAYRDFFAGYNVYYNNFIEYDFNDIDRDTETLLLRIGKFVRSKRNEYSRHFQNK